LSSWLIVRVLWERCAIDANGDFEPEEVWDYCHRWIRSSIKKKLTPREILQSKLKVSNMIS
jgi:hypothetical protein